MPRFCLCLPQAQRQERMMQRLPRRDLRVSIPGIHFRQAGAPDSKP